MKPYQPSSKNLLQRAGDWLAESFVHFLAWSPARKTTLMFAVLLLGQLLFLTGFEVFVARDDRVEFELLRLAILISTATIVMILVASIRWARRGSDTRAPYYLMIFLYGGSYCFLNYTLGLFDSVYASVGILMAAALMLLDGWKTGVMTIMFWSAATISIDVAQEKEWLPYASSFVGRSLEFRTSDGWRWLTYAWSLTAAIMLVLLIWLISNSRRHAQEAADRSRAMIRRYVPPAVVEHILAGDEAAIDVPQRRRVSVLLADIAGFTRITDRVEAEVVAEVLNEHMSTMADIIERHGGTLNEIAGDGLMALFGAPAKMEPEEHARSAVRTALAMQRVMPELNERWAKLGLGEAITIRIGINTGILSVGSFGSQGRMTYTAIGLQTNIAGRIEAECEPGGVLISESTWQLVHEDIECVPRGQVKMKGVHYPVKIYQPKQ